MQKICQSCGMPMKDESIYGTNADGSKNSDYCIYCYKDGKFLQDCTMDEMIWRDGDTEYYPGGVTDPNYCVLKFTATDGRFYADYYPRSFIIGE